MLGKGSPPYLVPNRRLAPPMHDAGYRSLVFIFRMIFNVSIALASTRCPSISAQPPDMIWLRRHRESWQRPGTMVGIDWISTSTCVG